MRRKKDVRYYVTAVASERDNLADAGRQVVLKGQSWSLYEGGTSPIWKDPLTAKFRRRSDAERAASEAAVRAAKFGFDVELIEVFAFPVEVK